MGFAFLILFTLAEIALVVMTLTRWGEKLAWLKNRTLVQVAETALLLGIVLVPATHLKWRFLTALAVLAVRLAIAGIIWLVQRRTATGIRKRPPTVVNCIFSVVLVAFALVPAFVFTNYNGLPTTGEYQVLEAEAILVDASRTDPFETDGTPREVPAHFYYPEGAQEACPLVVFSHGAFGYYQSNYSTYAELVSHGYVVVALDHPHHAFFTKDTAGQTVLVDTDFINDVMRISSLDDLSAQETFDLSHQWLSLRVEDENFVLDTILAAKARGTLDDAWHTADGETLLQVLAITDTGRIGLMGHSLGGASSVALGRQRQDIAAVADLDGTMLGEIVGVKNGVEQCEPEPYPVPVLDLTREDSYNDRRVYQNETGALYVNDAIIANALEGQTVVMAHGGHMSFTDLPMISPLLGSLLGSGGGDSEAFLKDMNAMVLNWFDYYLKHEGTLELQAK